MIINFCIGNWMSFRGEAEFNLLASSERQHGDRVPRVESMQKRVLPIAAIYGGNASGKTNLFRALHALQALVVQGVAIDAPIQVEPFRLDAQAAQQPCRFAIEVLIDERVWDYRVTCTRQVIMQESLAIVTRSSTRPLFTRDGDLITLGDGLQGDRAALDFVAKGTRSNQLFVTNAVSQKIAEFRPLYDWLRDRLVLIAPDSRFAPFEQLIDRQGPYQNLVGSALERLDTGITDLDCEPVELTALGLPPRLVNDLTGQLKANDAVRLVLPETQDRVIIRRNAQGDLEAQRLVCFHRGSAGERVHFDLRNESDGSQRAIDLLPAFMSLQQHPVTFVIDELDRSLHTQLTRALITGYLGTCSTASRSQLLFTTHDVQLLDQRLLRRDEMWLVERDQDGVSSLASFSDFNRDNRYDKDIRKAYLLGRMGGVPRLRPWPVPMTASGKGTP
jgi:hypothetical protein